MSERWRSLLITALLLVLGVTLATLISTQPASIDRVERLGGSIKCPVCQGESIADSPSQMAEDMMDLVAQRVDQGATDQEIIDELLRSYSGAVLLDPPFSGSTLVLWIAPLAVLVIGAGVIVWWRRHPGAEAAAEPVRPRSRARLIAGALILVASFSAIVLIAVNSVQDRAGETDGVAALEGQDLSQVSNETMEAVIAANADNPAVNGMRLALAERYYEGGDYRSAFPHYLTVAEDPGADDEEAVTALIRLGWMAYDGNGEVETATRLLDEALAIDPASQVALYLRATVRWCGAGEPDVAVDIFEDLLADPSLPAESRDRIEAEVSAARLGEECP